VKRHLFFREALLPSGWARDVRISLEAGRVAAVQPQAAPITGDEQHDIALPGIPNVHSHSFQRAMAGFAERRGPAEDNFWTWREAMYLFANRIDPASLQAIAALAFMEMLEAGFTRVGEFHYLHHDKDGARFADIAEMAGAIVRASDFTGLGLTLLPVLYQHSGFGGAAPGDGQKRFVCSLDEFARLVDSCARHLSIVGDGVLGVAPHSLRAVGPEALQVAIGMNEGPIHIHAAEQTGEVEACLAWSGMRPVEWLVANCALDSRWCLVHATHMTSVETSTLAASGAVAGLCPITEANLGDGIFPALEFLNAGGAFGVGGDSNVRIDAAEELRQLEYAQRLIRRERNVLARTGGSVGSTLLTQAVAGGSQALGVPGGIKPGASADIVSLRSDSPTLAGKTGEQIADAFIFAGGRELIDCVWRAGEKVVEQGRHRARDAIVETYNSTVRQLLA
jgi:formimidoylglutamate deiminase